MSFRNKILTGLVLLAILGGGILAGCSQSQKGGTAAPVPAKKVVFGDWGVGPTCLAPFYTAIEDGYFAQEGLEVEHVRYPGMKEVYEAVSLGKADFSAVPTHLVNLLEEGFNLKSTLAIHPGCMQGIADINQPIYSVKDLKGKRIGLDALGHCPHAFTLWELTKAGLEPDDVQFKVYPPGDLPLALKKGEVDFILPLDPVGQLALNQGIGRLVFSTTYPEHGYSDVYCCTLVINGDLTEKDKGTAAAITRAVANAAKSIPGREDQVAQMMIDRKYSIGSPDVHGFLLKQYRYDTVSVAGVKDTLRYYGTMYKHAGIVREDTDVEKLIDKSFRQLIDEVGKSTVPPPPRLP
ncbi:MAG: ABC transporter substrate-binding protein [Chloroflexota bacterium]